MRKDDQQRLKVIPMTWREACAFITLHHRHHKPPRGQKFAIGCVNEANQLVGVATCGRPVSRALDGRFVLEVNRTCTNGFPNANSFLYGACYRIAMAMGYQKVITDIQDGESGSSLRAAGWKEGLIRKPRKGWRDSSKKLAHLRDPIGTGDVARIRWEKEIKT